MSATAAQKAAQRRWRAKNKDKIAAYARRWRVRAHDATEASVSEIVRHWQAQNPPTPRPFSLRHCAQFPDESRERNYRRSYGITVPQYEAMLAGQQGCCAICRKPPKGRRLAVDHCHTTKAVRGLLCVKCNTAIGKLNDDPIILQRALDYLFFYM